MIIFVVKMVMSNFYDECRARVFIYMEI